MNRRDDKCIELFLWDNLEGRDHLEDLGIDGKKISAS
jgi:hypothetical protein